MASVTRATAKQALLDIYRDEGVEYVFGMREPAQIHATDALDLVSDIRYVLGLDEVVCAGMAEGYARASGRPGVLDLHTSLGLVAATPPLYGARLGRVPLVVIVGLRASRSLQSDPHLSGAIGGVGSLFAKWSTQVAYAADVPTALRRAFKMAMQPPRGPVVVALPQDVLKEEFDYDPAPSTPVFAGLRPDPAGVERAIILLGQAESPLLLVDSGVARSGAVAEAVEFAELTGARVYQTGMADVDFPVAHPHYLGDLDLLAPQARAALAAADLLIGVGCSLFAEGFFAPAAPSLAKVKVLQIDDDPWELSKNLPTDCAIQGDIKASLAELNATLRARAAGQGRAAARRAAIATEKAALAAAAEARDAAEREFRPISVSRLMSEVAGVAGPETITVDECGSFSETLRRILRPSLPGTYQRSRTDGSLGWGIPAALGAQLGAPNRRVLAVVDKAAGASSLPGLRTAARYRIPLTVVIANDATNGAEVEALPVDFSLLARSCGVGSERVTDPAWLNGGLAEALASGEPRLLEVLVQPPR
jgi:benzoylformate decarboxylase